MFLNTFHFHDTSILSISLVGYDTLFISLSWYFPIPHYSCMNYSMVLVDYTWLHQRLIKVKIPNLISNEIWRKQCLTMKTMCFVWSCQDILTCPFMTLHFGALLCLCKLRLMTDEFQSMCSFSSAHFTPQRVTEVHFKKRNTEVPHCVYSVVYKETVKKQFS